MKTDNIAINVNNFENDNNNNEVYNLAQPT